MKSSVKCLIICVFLSFTAGFIFSEEIVHVMQKGETIYSIARSYGTSADEVLKLNRISDPSKVQAGAKIRIPSAASSPAQVRPANPQQGYSEYLVEKNDTLYSLARRNGISVSDLLEFNGFSTNYVLKAGEKIKIPAPGSSRPSPQPAGQNSTQASGTSGTATTAINLDPAIKWPIKAKEIAQITGRLNGVQLTGERRESVKSLTGGTIVSAGPYRGFGRVAIVQTTSGYLYVYGGCETLSVKEGDKISAGSEVGKLGIDTKTSKSQLFFFVYKGNTSVDPAKAPRT